MSKSLRLSPKHGLNMTIPVCFWCGKEKNELALMGKVTKRDENGKIIEHDVEMPMHVLLNYEPCKECEEMFAQGVHLIEVCEESPDGRPPITKSPDGKPGIPTGTHCVIKSDAAKKIFNIDPSMLENGKTLALEKEVYQELIPKEKA